MNREWIPYLVLGVSLLITAFVAVTLHRTSHIEERARFQNAVQRTRDTLQTRLEIYTNMLQGAAALFQAEPDRHVQADQFHSYMNSLDLRHRYPSVQGVGYVAVVRPEEKDAFVTSIHSVSGLTDFRIWPDYPRTSLNIASNLRRSMSSTMSPNIMIKRRQES